MAKIGIFINPEKDPNLCYLAEVMQILDDNKIEYYVSCGKYKAPNLFSFSSIEKCFKGSSLVLTLGGDGTLLQAAPYANKYKTPLLGINLGHLGFLAELERYELNLLPEIIFGDFEYTERMMLKATVIRDDKVLCESIALNDAVIQNPYSKPAHIKVSDQKSDLLDYYCDGFIIATATGSTAYSMSAGGPILEPQSDAIVVTPICPHSLNVRSVVFGAANLSLDVRVTNATSIFAALFCDGKKITDLEKSDIIRITRHRTPIRLIKLSNKSFYKVLNDKISRRKL